MVSSKDKVIFAKAQILLFGFEGTILQLSGDYSKEVTPVPIPNTVVKLLCANDTWWATAWESRTLPDFLAPWSSGQDTALSRR
jgi:hypothetical protein